MIASTPKPARRSAKPRKRIKSRKPLGWKRRAAKRANAPDPDMLDMVIKFYRGMCAYCGCAAAESWDHVVPISKHGPNTVANLVPSCVRCNMTKGTQMWEPRRMHPYA